MLIDLKDLKIVLEEDGEGWIWKVLRKETIQKINKDNIFTIEETDIEDIGFEENGNDALKEAERAKLRIIGWI